MIWEVKINQIEKSFNAFIIVDMKKLTIKSIINFRGKSEVAKKKFASDLKLNVEKNDAEGGGDYWISSLSAISKAYKANDVRIIKAKIDEIQEKWENEEYKRTKIMYQRNMDILYHYEAFDFKKWQPTKKINYLKKAKANSIVTVEELPIQATPHHVFSFKRNDIEEIGAIWFIAKLGGYRKDELGMFADILYRYLRTNYSKEYVVNPKYCIAIDVFTLFDINYSQLQEGVTPQILSGIVDQIKKMM